MTDARTPQALPIAAPATPSVELRARLRSPPATPAVMFQSWRNLLFLHWEWDADEIQRTLPPGLFVDRHEGRSFLGVVPFEMRRVRPRFAPAIPGISDFLELNLRTYVHDADGIPGVWFYSLDANQRLAVAVARGLFRLPYHWARMQLEQDADGVTDFASARAGDVAMRTRFRYRPCGKVRQARPGSLEFFLLERYLLFADTPRGLRVGRVHHEPYRFQDVDRLAWGEELFELDGFRRPGRAPEHAVLSPGVGVSIYATRPTDDALR